MDTRPTKSADLTERVQLIDTVSVSEMLQQLGGFIRRQFPIFLLLFSCAAVLAGIYLFTTPPHFTANALLVIDSSKMRFLQQQQGPLIDVPLDTAQVETQVEVLKSDNIGLSVIKDQHLVEDDEFMKSDGGLFGAVFALISG